MHMQKILQGRTSENLNTRNKGMNHENDIQTRERTMTLQLSTLRREGQDHVMVEFNSDKENAS